jgi:hypothetical protein
MASSLGTQAILTKADFTLLPLAIRHADQWITWDAGEKRPGRYEKWQKDVSSRRHIDDVMPQLGDRLGLARVMSDGFAVLDLDKVATSPRDRKSLVAWAQPVVARALKLGYVEWSHSGRGLHIIMRDVPQDWQRKRAWRADDGSGYDWIAGENLCHLTMDSLDHLGGTICVPASEMIALLPQPVEAVPAVTAPAPRVLTTRFEIAPSDARKHGYGENAMERLIDEFSKAGEGARNKALNWISYRLGQLDAAGTIADAQQWLDVVQSTAGAIGLGNREIVSTMRSGYDAGLRDPARIDWRDDEPRERHAADAPVQSVASDAVVVPEASGGVTAPARRYTSLIHASDLANLPQTTWLVDKLLGLGIITQFFGKPGAGKSLAALDVALTIAQHMPVVYVAGEAPGELAPRIHAWCQHTRSQGPGQFYVYPEAINLRDRDQIGALSDECRALEARMIIIDPLAECLGAAGLDENAAQDMGIAVAALRTLVADAGNPALLVVHHAGWDDAHERGSSALRGASRVVVRVAADADDNRVTLRVDKANNGKPFEELYYAMVGVADSVVLTPHHRAAPAADRPLSPMQLQLLEVLMLQQYRDGASQSALVDSSGQSRQTVSKSISRLLKRFMIQQTNTLFSITEKGQQYLEGVAAAGGIGTAALASEDGRYNWRVNPVSPLSPVSPVLSPPCPLSVASVSPVTGDNENLSPVTGDKGTVCPLSPGDSVPSGVASGAIGDSALQCETSPVLSPMSPDLSPICPLPVPLSPVVGGPIRPPTGDKGQGTDDMVGDIVEAVEPAVEVVEARVVPPEFSWYFRDAAPGATDMVIVDAYMDEPIGGRRYIAVSEWGTDRAGVAHGTDPDGYTDEWKARKAARLGNAAWPKLGIITL